MIKCRIKSLGSEKDGFGNPTHAVIHPIEAPELECSAVIPWNLRGKAGNLIAGTEVVAERFVDGTALIVATADGNWGNVVYTDGLKIGDDTASSYIALADEVKNALTQLQLWANTHTHQFTGSGKVGTPETSIWQEGVPSTASEVVKSR